TAGERRRRIDRDHRDALALRAEAFDQAIDERRLPRAGRTGDPEHVRMTDRAGVRAGCAVRTGRGDFARDYCRVARCPRLRGVAGSAQTFQRRRQIENAVLHGRDRAREVAVDARGDQKTGFSTYVPNTGRSALMISPPVARAFTAAIVAGMRFSSVS